MKSLLAIIAVFIYVSSACGNEEDIFEIDDFLDPRELGAEMRLDGSTIYGGEFRFFDIGAGEVNNFQDRATFTGEDKLFITFGYHKYYADSQINHRVTLLESGDNTVRYRLKSEYAKYRMRHRGRYVFRHKLSLVLDDAAGDSTEAEIAASTFVDILLPLAQRPFRGGVSASYRKGNGVSTFRALWFSSADLWQSEHANVVLTGGFKLGFERSNGMSRATPPSARLGIDYRLNSRTSLQFFYGPAYQRSDSGFEPGFNHQIGLMLYHMFASSYEAGI